MNIYTIAIGDSYIQEANRLKSYFPTLIICDNNEFNYDYNLLNGLAAKSKGSLNLNINNNDPVLALDSDILPHIENHLDILLNEIDNNCDIALVPYFGKWHFPCEIKQNIFNYFGKMLNSGLIYFKSKAIADEICGKWHEIYINRVASYTDVCNEMWEMDEPSLMQAIIELNQSRETPIKIQYLDSKFNDWELINENPVYTQEHIKIEIDNLDIQE